MPGNLGGSAYSPSIARKSLACRREGLFQFVRRAALGSGGVMLARSLAVEVVPGLWRRYPWLSMIILAMVVSACGRHSESENDHAHEAEAEVEASAEAGLQISLEAQENAGLTYHTLEHVEHPVPLQVTGVINAVPSRQVHLRPLAAGVIRRIYVNLGDRVHAGQPLVEYDNVALGDHVGEYRSAVAALGEADVAVEVRERSYQRAQRLIELEAIAEATLDLRRAELENARAARLSARAEAERIEERLRRFGLSEDEIRNLVSFAAADEAEPTTHPGHDFSLNVIRSPFDGVVTEYALALGDLVSPDRELLTITDISTVWVLADVYAYDIGRLPAEAEVAIRVDAYPDRVFRGRSTYVSDTIELSTRAAHVRCEVPNPDAALKIGMFASVTIPSIDAISSIAAPIEAVQHIDGQPVVFVRTSPDTFARRDVTMGSVAAGMVGLSGDLHSGEEIVAEGSFYLKTESLLGRIGHSH